MVYYGYFGLVSIIITIISISNSLKSKKEVSLIERKIKKAQKLMKKTGDASIIYKALDEEVLPALVLNQMINKNQIKMLFQHQHLIRIRTDIFSANLQCDRPFFGVLYRICQQMHDNLLDAHLIAPHRTRHLLATSTCSCSILLFALAEIPKIILLTSAPGCYRTGSISRLPDSIFEKSITSLIRNNSILLDVSTFWAY